MAALFADPGCWSALIDSSERLHSRPRTASDRLYELEIVTTQMALVETLASQAGSGGTCEIARYAAGGAAG